MKVSRCVSGYVCGFGAIVRIWKCVCLGYVYRFMDMYPYLWVCECVNKYSKMKKFKGNTLKLSS